MTDLNRFDLEVLLSEDAVTAAGQKAAEVLADGQAGKRARAVIPMLGDRMRTAIDDELAAFDPLAVFAQGWSKARELATIPAGKRTHVRLGKHVVEHDFHPVLTIRFGPLACEPITFTLTVRAEIEAVELKIVDRYITRVGGGVVKLGVLLKYDEQALGGSKKLCRYDIPGDYKFTEPVRIPGAG